MDKIKSSVENDQFEGIKNASIKSRLSCINLVKKFPKKKKIRRKIQLT